MRFYIPDWRDARELAARCLKIGSRCVICDRPGRPDVDICDDCESWLPRCHQTDGSGLTRWLCLACGDESTHRAPAIARHSGCCEDCLAAGGPFSRIVAPYRYDFPVDRLIRRLKYHDQRSLARVFGTLLADAVKAADETRPLPDLLVPVPLHRSRRRVRGYNQSADLARWCARELGLRCAQRAADREYDTGSLAGLSRLQRQHRILGAFRADPLVAGQHVAIVDDVLTSGSTARELARELYDTGVSSVELWVLARTASSR
ncbi:MAG: ComF family protein [Granulosicoccus sp.]|nr:ComF family protein [Granulosicoccus sp.]